MTDITERLERLARLRTAGLLTVAEFEQEKRHLLASSASTSAVDPSAILTDAPTADIQPPYPLIVRIFAGLGLVALLIGIFAVIGWLLEIKEADERQEQVNSVAAQATVQQWAEETANGIEQAVAQLEQMGDGIARLQPTGWSIGTKRDPMNDLQVTTATTLIATAPFMVEVAVTCTGNQALVYDFVAFDEIGQPANFRRRITDKGRQQTSFSVRVDRAPAFDVIDTDMRNSNVARLISLSLYEQFDVAETAARGTSLTVQLPLETGEPVVKIDQSNPPMRHMLDNCLKELAARREWVKAHTTTWGA
ncbi:SHOCT domain-containing protein [Sphingomonas crocodyli]|uniref:SHOCT domain-containing protein n=1 Tax=Sphingomonas crocodyli TaxID=1979270 RepID=A0A437M6K0_9SPHN|nr:SHOCT domain-containing protein [Sphingomonas crocodyli]RVT93124.1 SHOCT domain-containing protein [Sphingomonas crocodyli]